MKPRTLSRLMAILVGIALVLQPRATVANSRLVGIAAVVRTPVVPGNARALGYGIDVDDTRVASEAPDGDILIDDFEGPAPLSHWFFGGGTGTTSSLALTTGHAGQGARFAYDLSYATPAEAYAWANRPLDSPASAPAVAFWVKSPPGIYLRLQVSDDAGQMLQYSLVRPFGKMNPQEWYRHVGKLDPTPEHWDGANDGVVHGAIHSVTLVVADLTNAQSSGVIDFDEVALVKSLAVSLNPYIQSASAARAGSGDLATRLAVNIHFPTNPDYVVDDRALDAARSGGFSWVRHDLPWAAVETTPGIYDFTPWDTLVAHLQARAMRALFIVDQGNTLYTGGWQIPPTTASAIQAFGAYVEAAARHYAGQPVQFEIWNESNLANFWPPAADANQYAALAQEAITRIHQGSSSAKVSTAGLSGFDFPFLRSILGTGCANSADAIGIHPYGVPRPELVSDNVLLMRALVSQMLPANPPIWDTEWGYSSAAFGNGRSSEARARQAIMAFRELLSAWAAGFPLVVYYDIRDDGSDPNDWEHNFGLLANDYSEKPAMQAVRTMSTAASGRTLVGFVDIQPTSLHALRLDGASDVLVALWSDAPGGQVDVALPPWTTAVNYLGVPLSLTPGNGGLIVAVRESDGPVYLTFPQQSVVFLPLVLK
jgi:catechol 2,3-dioxygenase-like lactoylglutathione lyase family enzyme